MRGMEKLGKLLLVLSVGLAGYGIGYIHAENVRAAKLGNDCIIHGFIGMNPGDVEKIMNQTISTTRCARITFIPTQAGASLSLPATQTPSAEK